MGSARGADRPTSALAVWQARVAESGGEAAFFHREPQGWRPTTWREADRVAREIAAGLVAAGVVPGDRVCVLAQTRLEWVLVDVAIVMAGAVSVPIYPSNTGDQCRFIIRDSSAKVVIAEDDVQLAKLGRIDGVRTISMASVDDGVADSLATLRQAGARWLQAKPADLAAPGTALDRESLFTIIYTSGTTGEPKGVMLSHENLISAVDSAIRAFTIGDDDQQFLFLPLAHVLGRELEWVAIRVGAPTWIGEGLTKVKENLLEVRPTFFATVPRLFEKVYATVQATVDKERPRKRRLIRWSLATGGAAQARVREGGRPGVWLALKRRIAERLVLKKLRTKIGLDRARFLMSGGAPLAADIAAFFHACGILILEGYGLTETMAAAFVNRPERFRFGTVGPALDVVDVKIADDGEILMRGPSVFGGYWNNAEATAEAIDHEGWFHSGDIGHVEDGFLRITDRKKDLIVTAGGKKVAPQPIENALKIASPLISQALVYGDRRPYCVALLTLSEEAMAARDGAPNGSGLLDVTFTAELQRAVDAVNANLAPFETIKRFAVLPEDFTEANGQITPSLKVKRKVVIEKYRSVLDGLYAAAEQDASA